MEDSEYHKYVQRAEFFNATGRTVDGLHGQMFRKDVTVEVPKNLKEYLKNVDGKGHSFAQFVSEVAYQSLITSWGGILLDAPVVDGVISKADAKEKGVYPFLQYVCAENLYNWHYDNVNRVKKLTRVSIKNRIEVPTGDPFTYDEKDEFKLLYLDEMGNYTQDVMIDGLRMSTVQPTRKGQALKSLPFYPLPNTDPEKPIILDLVNENLAWYRKSADLENGGHWTGVPTPYILGYEPEIKYDENGQEKARDPIYLGGSSILCLPTGSQIGYLEYHGTGLGQLRQMMMDDEDRMAILGARIISAERRGTEAVETAKIHRAGENSVLATFANNLSIVFKRVLVDYLEWITETDIDADKITVAINTDYDVSRMNSGEITALVSLWQSGGLSKKELFKNLKDGEIISNDLSFEDMEKDIAEEKEQSMQDSLDQQSAQMQLQLQAQAQDRIMYKLVTGFYPSDKTAQKILKKVKGNCKTARVEKYDGGYTVVLAQSDSYDEIDNMFSKYMKLKIYCGILPEKA